MNSTLILQHIFEIIEILRITVICSISAIMYKYKIFYEDTTKYEEVIQREVIVITGAQRGIGKTTAKEFAKRGAIVVLGCVDLKKGQQTQEEIKRTTGNNYIDLFHLDLSEMSSVRQFAYAVTKKYPKIKLLLINAGIGAAPNGNEKTKDGFNLHMAVNYLGHFLLTNLLVPNMTKGSRVVAISSTLLLLSRLDFGDFMMDESDLLIAFDSGLPYANSKFALSLFINQLGKRLKNKGITTYSLCPGVVNTKIYEKSCYLFQTFAYMTGFSTEKACDGIVYCALNKNLGSESGNMYRFQKPFNEANARFDSILGEQLWDLSAKLVKL